MSLGIYNKDLYGRQGDRMLPLTFTFTDGNGEKIDISNYKFFIEIQYKSDKITTYYLKGPLSQDQNGITFDPSSLYEGVKYNAIIWDTGLAITLEPKQYNYAVKFITGENHPTTIIEGKLIIDKQLVTPV